MTIAEELYQMGIPKAECPRLAEELLDAAVVSGVPNAIDRMLVGLRILIQKGEPAERAANYPAGLLKK